MTLSQGLSGLGTIPPMGRRSSGIQHRPDLVQGWQGWPSHRQGRRSWDYRGGVYTPGSINLYPAGQDDTGPRIRTAEDILTSQTLDPLCILFFGRRGDGKTLSMMGCLGLMREAYRLHGKLATRRNPQGFKLATNIHCKFAQFNNPMLVDLIIDFPPWAYRLTLGVDEILAYFPSRRTMARGNLNFATFLQQIRKRDIELFCTTQFPQNLDGQILEQLNLFVMPVLYNRKNSVRLLIWDWWGQYTGRMWRKYWPPMMSGEPPDFTLDIHGLRGLFPLFSTKEVVHAMWSSSRDEGVEYEWQDEMAEYARHYAPDAVEMENEPPESRPPQNLRELVESLPPDIWLLDILDQAKSLDSRIKNTKTLGEHLRSEGWYVWRDGPKGFRAILED